MPGSDEPFLSAKQQDDGSLLVVAGGAWSIQSTVPSWDEVEKFLETSPGPASVRFDCSSLRTWDSSLASVLTRLTRLCRDEDIALDATGMPEGLKRLVTMALAVPERNIRPTPERELFFTRIGKAGLTLGGSVVEVFAFIGHVCLSLGRLLRGRGILRWSDTWLIIQRCGAEALPIVTLINFLVGVILGFVSGVQLRKFGAENYMATLVGIAMARELGCLMTGIIMSGRTGAAFAAELGSMKANQEIDALKTLGLSPIDFLVLPRVLALVFMLPLLTVYGDVMGMLGGAVLAPGFGVSFLQYYQQLIASVDAANYAAGIAKAAVFGAVVAGAGCLKGMESGNSSSAVGLSTTSAVVTSITAIIALDAVFAFVLTALGV